MIKFQTIHGNLVVEFSITVVLDDADRAILESLKNSNHGRTASQIFAILEYNGVRIKIGELRERLRRLASISVVGVQKGKRTDRYNLLLFNSSYVS